MISNSYEAPSYGHLPERQDRGESTRSGDELPQSGRHHGHESESEDQPEKPITSAKDWTGSNDPDNPLNWPLWKKWYMTSIPAGLALVATFASSVYTPGIDEVTRELDTSVEVSRLAYSIYILGLACGAVITAPCSETIGRRIVYLVSIPIFCLFVLGSGFSKTIASLIITRFFAGVFASPSLSIGSGMLSDMWPPAQRAVPMAAYVTTPFLGPSLGPLIGGFAVEAKGWIWTFWITLFFAIAFFTPAMFMDETYKHTILQKRAKTLGVEGPASPVDGFTISETASYFFRKTLTRPLHMLFTEPVVAAFSTYVAFNFALLYAFFTAFPYVWENQYDFSLGSIGLTFLGVGVGCLLGFAFLIYPDRALYRRRLAQAKQKDAQTTKLPSEERLYASMVGGLLIPPSLFMFGWSATYRVHWIVPVIAEAMFGAGNILVFMSAVIYTMDFYGPLFGASAQAANTLLRYLLAFCFPLFSVQMYQGMGIGWASSLLGFVSAAMTMIPFLFWQFGPALRARSRYLHGTG